MGHLTTALGVAAILLAAASSAVASTVSGSAVSAITVSTDGHVYFEANQNRTTPPACATYTRWVFDPTTALGQSMMATLLTGSASGKQFSVYGTGTCLNSSEQFTVFLYVN